jgi:TolB protein
LRPAEAKLPTAFRAESEAEHMNNQFMVERPAAGRPADAAVAAGELGAIVGRGCADSQTAAAVMAVAVHPLQDATTSMARLHVSAPSHHHINCTAATKACQVWLVALLLACLSLATGQQPPVTPAPPPDIGVPAEELWLKLTSSGGRRKLDLVLADFGVDRSAPPALAATAREVQAVFQADLRFSLHFTFEEPDSGRQFTFSSDAKKPDLKGWASTGAQVLVAGAAAAGRGLTLRLYDLEMERLIASKEYALETEPRWLAHTMADEVIKLLTGEGGVNRTRVAFSRSTGPETKELALTDYDGAGLSQLTSSGGLKLYPDWSGDGTKLAFSSYGTSTLNTYTLDIGTRRQTLVSDRSGLNTTPAWSADGRSIAASLSFEGQPEIYLMDPAGRNLRRLTASPGIDISPSWSPDGRQLAFVSDRTGSPQVYVINADGTDLRRLTFEGSYNTSPTWSPRGDLVAFVQRQPGGTNQVCVTNLMGDTYMRLTSGANCEDPSWSPDGLHLVFSSNRSGRYELYTMDWNGSNQRRITSVGGAFSPSWSPRLGR